MCIESKSLVVPVEGVNLCRDIMRSERSSDDGSEMR